MLLRLLSVALLAALEPSAPRRGAASRPGMLSRRAVLPTLATGSAALLAAAAAKPASASFGPAGAAVVSVPDLLRISVEEWLSLPAEKALQRIGSVNTERVRSIAEQLEEIVADQSLESLGQMKKRLEDDANDYNSTSSYAELQALQVQAERRKSAIALARQLRAREKLLKSLEAQPLPIVYGAAALASVGSTLVMHPVDTFKTLQITAANAAEAEAKAAAAAGNTGTAGARAAPPPPPMALPPLQELYVGLLPNLVKEAPSSALYLGIYELVRSALMAPGGPCESSPLLAYLVAGAAGEFVGSVIRAPAEATKCRVQSGLASSPGEAFGQVLAKPSQLLTAWSSSLWRDVPMGAVQIAVFELLKAYCINDPAFGANVNTLPAEAAFGALGGLVGAILTTPADVVTTRIITASEQQGEAGGEAEAEAEAGPLEVAQAILSESGPAGFFVGVGSRGLYWAPAIGIFLSLYCSLRQMATVYLA